MKKLLIHTCCAPCLVYIYEDLTKLHQVVEEKDLVLTSYYYNPNIHPKVELERRMNTLKEYCVEVGLDLAIDMEYNLKQFTKSALENENRCRFCYTLRLEKTFLYAKEHGYDMVMTSLCISPYQNLSLLNTVGNELSKKYGIEYIQPTYSEKFRQGQAMAKELGLYRQKYCGCIFSMDDGKWEY